MLAVTIITIFSAHKEISFKSESSREKDAALTGLIPTLFVEGSYFSLPMACKGVFCLGHKATRSAKQGAHVPHACMQETHSS